VDNKSPPTMHAIYDDAASPLTLFLPINDDGFILPFLVRMHFIINN